jgi:hypothetical protein
VRGCRTCPVTQKHDVSRRAPAMPEIPAFEEASRSRRSAGTVHCFCFTLLLERPLEGCGSAGNGYCAGRKASCFYVTLREIRILRGLAPAREADERGVRASQATRRSGGRKRGAAGAGIVFLCHVSRVSVPEARRTCPPGEMVEAARATLWVEEAAHSRGHPARNRVSVSHLVDGQHRVSVSRPVGLDGLKSLGSTS